MPREADPSDLEPVFPWEDWRKQLRNSPTGALIFNPDDFGEMSPRKFREKARKMFPKARVSIRGDEVLVFDAQK